EERLPAILPMLDDLGCNIVRCWGGNVYENDLFYDYCDAHGIMVWQDFAMACGVYPQDREFLDAMREEVIAVVKRLRNHPSIILWAGDNECDCAYAWGGEDRDPNDNRITREIIPDVLRITDYSRPYLPSSPYIDEEAYRTRGEISENHLWGPRDYFKGDYYRNTVCHFASETGYHGCPSPASLAKYIDPDHLWPCLGDREWLVHAATMDGREDSPYGYRIRLMWNQVETLFGKDGPATADLASFSLASQISQAEAKKYFIERFRLSKWRRTGIIWWNLIDGWPQISDAIVDYYLDRKLAYSYIRRSQKPFCLMFDEPEDGRLTLYAVNDTRTAKTFNYSVTNDRDHVILAGSSRVGPDESAPVASIPATAEKRYYLIRWDDGEERGINHYFANIRDIDLAYYQTLLDALAE
ncbi:MAG: glycoside hydrolase family 2, partial [Clostridia bacterium]|nr:glycoside hydrolase family 2 [Clostridia bacterium]